LKIAIGIDVVGGGVFADTESMILEVQTTGASETFTLPLGNTSTYNFNIDWGDNSSDTITTYNDADLAHVYADAGTYTVTLTNNQQNFGQIRFDNGGDKTKLKKIKQWGTGFTWHNFDDAFFGCSAMDIEATDELDCTEMTSLNAGFRGCTSITTGANLVNIGAVSMKDIYTGCSSLTTVSQMSTELVTNFQGSFNGCSSLETWPITSTASATGMFAIFQNCSSLVTGGDINLSSTTGGVNTAGNIFINCSSLETVGTITLTGASFASFNYIFANCSSLTTVTFSGSLPASCVKLDSTFRNTALTTIPDLGYGNVEDWSSAFRDSTSLNSFDFSAFDYSSADDMGETWTGLTLLTSVYDQMIQDWSNNNVNTNVPVGAGGSKYTNSGATATAYTDLTVTRSPAWSIADGGAV
jgi:hypothetical protein